MNQATKLALNFDILTENTTINVPADFPTIQEALDSLNRTFIPPDVKVTIKVAAGIYEHTERIDVTVPFGQQIIISGEAPVEVGQIVSFDGITRPSGYILFTFTLSNSSHGLEPGDVVKTSFTGGTGFYHSCIGAFVVDSVSGASVTVRSLYRNATGSLTGITFSPAGTISKFPTVLKFAASSGINIPVGARLGTLRNVALVGNRQESAIKDDHGTSGIIIRTGGYVQCYNVAAIEFYNHGISAIGVGAHGDISGCYMCHNGGNGFSAWNGGCSWGSGNVAYGNAGSGFNYDCAANGCSALSSMSIGNNYGHFVKGGTLYMNNSIAALNASGGVVAHYSTLVNATSVISFCNGTSDFNSWANSFILATSTAGYGAYAPVYSPAVNTEGQSLSSYISK